MPCVGKACLDLRAAPLQYIRADVAFKETSNNVSLPTHSHCLWEALRSEEPSWVQIFPNASPTKLHFPSTESAAPTCLEHMVVPGRLQEWYLGLSRNRKSLF